MARRLELLLALVCFVPPTRHLVGAKVVVFFPVPVTSHVRYHTNVAKAVAEQGHEAWVCIPDYLATGGRIDTSGIKVLHYGHSLGHLEDAIRSQTRLHELFWENRTQSVLDMYNIGRFIERINHRILDEGLAEKVRAVKPSLFVLDDYFYVRPILVVPYKLGVPHAVVGSLHDAAPYRIPFSAAATPVSMFPFGDRMDFWTRTENALRFFFVFLHLSVLEPDTVSLYAPEKPHTTLNELVAQSEVFISEMDHIMDYPRTSLPNTKLVGGTAAKEAKPLKEPFKSFMNKSTQGVILVSFGSAVVHVPDYIFSKIYSACRDSGMNVVWRTDRPSPDPERVLTSEWLPQNDILGHANTKLFLSHCGKNGQYEALFHGVPILGLPIFAEQFYNAERIRAKGYGLKADMRSITREELSGVVKELLTNASYRTTIGKASGLFRQLYKSPMKEAAFWLDHVMTYGGEYMRAASQTMPLYQFLMLDVLAVVVALLALVSVVLFVLVRWCLRLVWKPSSKSKTD